MVDRWKAIAGPSNARAAVRGAVLLAAALLLSSCGSFFAGLPGIGQPEGTPARPDVTAEYPHVFRTKNPDERPPPEGEAKKLEAELAQERTGAAEERRRKIQQPTPAERRTSPRENR